MSRFAGRLRKSIIIGSQLAGVAGVGLFAAIYVSSMDPKPYKIETPIDSVLFESDPKSKNYWRAPLRDSTIKKLVDSSSPGGTPFDLLVVGGGATGAGCALDAAVRGLSVALVEASDFSSGTSSKSTKLVHGGVRYLEKAFWNLDYEQFKLVNSALKERGIFVKVAPFISYKIPLMVPNYSWWQAPYYYSGTKVYSMIARFHGDSLCESGYMTKSDIIQEIPGINPTGLIGAVVYFDGAHNDSRMNALLTLTSAAHGATVANYVEVVDLLKRPRTNNIGKFGFGPDEIYGAVCRDNITGKVFNVHSKGVISATGALSDLILRIDLKEKAKDIVVASRGTHIVVPSVFGSKIYGLLDARSSDGRVLFILPWENSCLIGTTDVACGATWKSSPTKDELQWILDETNKFLCPEAKIRLRDVLSVWSGIRPMVMDPESTKDTQEVARNHVITLTPSGLLVINGGKWTTYREMAEETIDKAVSVFNLEASKCMTEFTLVAGAHNWNKLFNLTLCKDFKLPTDIATHLSEYYGDRALQILELMEKDSSGHYIIKRLNDNYPYLEEEVTHAVRNEFALMPSDVVCRRLRIAFVNLKVAYDLLPRIVNIMKSELGWSSAKAEETLEGSKKDIMDMGYSLLFDIQ